jgi:ketosteroid isomerase-like protein
MSELVVAALLLALTAIPAFAGDVHEPAKGSPERAAILDAIRPAIEAQMRGPVEFQIETMRTDGDWAFVMANPQPPDGKPIDPEKTAFAGQENDMDGLTVLALARHVGGRWVHIDDIIGPMDAAQMSWINAYQVPKSVIGVSE